MTPERVVARLQKWFCCGLALSSLFICPSFHWLCLSLLLKTVAKLQPTSSMRMVNQEEYAFWPRVCLYLISWVDYFWFFLGCLFLGPLAEDLGMEYHNWSGLYHVSRSENEEQAGSHGRQSPGDMQMDKGDILARERRNLAEESSRCFLRFPQGFSQQFQEAERTGIPILVNRWGHSGWPKAK